MIYLLDTNTLIYMMQGFIGSLDLLIAAHAKALGAVLVTSDTADFSRIPGLQCQNWAV